MQKWKKIRSDLVYDSSYMKIRKDNVSLPNGEEKEWTYWDSNDSAMVLGMTKEHKLVMIQQYRYLVDDTVIEFPSGSLDSNEDPLEGARREFMEETNYEIHSSLIELGSFYETYGQLNRRIHIYFTNNITKKERRTKTDDFVDKYIEVTLIDYRQAIEYALDNKIVAMGSALAILLLNKSVEQGKIIIEDIH